MEALRTAILCACAAALGLGLTEHLIPLERFERQIRMMLAILMMTAILRPLTGLELSDFTSDLSAAEAQTAGLQEIALQAQEQAAAESICAALNRALRAESVPCEVYAVDVHISEDGSIIINEVTAGGNLLTGAVYLHEWLGDAVKVTEGGAPFG